MLDDAITIALSVVPSIIRNPLPSLLVAILTWKAASLWFRRKLEIQQQELALEKRHAEEYSAKLTVKSFQSNEKLIIISAIWAGIDVTHLFQGYENNGAVVSASSAILGQAEQDQGFYWSRYCTRGLAK